MPAPIEPASSRPDSSAGDTGEPGRTGIVTVRCAAGDADALTDLAWVHGATGVAEVAAGDAPGHVDLVIGVADADAADAVTAALAGDDRGHEVVAGTADDAWAGRWRSHARAHRAGPFAIRLDDHPPTDAPLEIVIEPGPTFGYGHPTTLLALELVARIDRPLGRVLDVGTGSGILSIGAARLGAAQVTALDIDPVAVATCRANARRNGVTVDSHIADATGDPLPGPAAGYDLILVNVTASVQRAVAERVRASAAPGALVVVSGILAAQEAAVVAAHHAATVVDRRRHDGWVALVLA